ncbi:MAG: flagellar basal body L-ring protein FlgH [Verrucomicrobiae bacterium]|nr:flagellar basal body L-ring protein FlgH [Verrucomicrobiae bacterium]
MKSATRLFTSLLLAQAFIRTTAPAQSLWHEETSRAIFADKRAAAIGDILTVVVQENTVANKNNETKTEKNSSLSAAITSFLYPAGATSWLTTGGKLPAMAYNSDLKHDGSGAINNSESIVAHIAVKIIDVLPNRTMLVEGKRETSFSGEHQTIVLHGLVRPEDVNPDNTVLSYNIADANIQIIGKGTVSNTQNKGWFTRIYDFVNPF